VEDAEGRRSISFSTRRLDDPVLRLQTALQQRLHELAPFSSAVSFARLGERK
jgi:hypothetical protein